MAHGYRILFGYPVPFDDPYAPAQQCAGYVYSSAEDVAYFLIPYFNDGRDGTAQVLEPLRDAANGGSVNQYMSCHPPGKCPWGSRACPDLVEYRQGFSG